MRNRPLPNRAVTSRLPASRWLPHVFKMKAKEFNPDHQELRPQYPPPVLSFAPLSLTLWKLPRCSFGSLKNSMRSSLPTAPTPPRCRLPWAPSLLRANPFPAHPGSPESFRRPSTSQGPRKAHATSHWRGSWGCLHNEKAKRNKKPKLGYKARGKV